MILDVFETFPAWDVALQMRENDPGPEKYKEDAVRNMYYHYKTGVENGVIPWYDSDKFGWEDTPHHDYVENMTNFPREWIDLFFWTLDTMTMQGKIKAIYIQVLRPESDPLAVMKSGAKTGYGLPKEVWTKLMWTIGIVGTVAVGVYVVPPVFKYLQSKRK